MNEWMNYIGSEYCCGIDRSNASIWIELCCVVVAWTYPANNWKRPSAMHIRCHCYNWIWTLMRLVEPWGVNWLRNNVWNRLRSIFTSGVWVSRIYLRTRRCDDACTIFQLDVGAVASRRRMYLGTETASFRQTPFAARCPRTVVFVPCQIDRLTHHWLQFETRLKCPFLRYVVDVFVDTQQIFNAAKGEAVNPNKINNTKAN